MTRPDTIDLIGAAYDSTDEGRADRTLLICSAPRTGSYELCRLMAAAGLGTPHEYFNPNYADPVAARWGLPQDPLSDQNISIYVETLRRRRSRNGVFAAKLQYWQYDRFLRNSCGAALLKEAAFVHLFRPDVAKQFRSFRAALVSGRWDFSEKRSRPPQPNSVEAARGSLEMLLREDAGFRRLFVLFNKTPLFLTTEDVVKRPRETAERVANLVCVEANLPAMDNMLNASAPYERDAEVDRQVSLTIERLRCSDNNKTASVPANVKKQPLTHRQNIRDCGQKPRLSKEQPRAAQQADTRPLSYRWTTLIRKLPWLNGALRRS